MTVIARPMLSATRQMVVDYLREIEQPFREDSSNLSDAFTRNRIRKLLPLLEAEFNPQVRDALFTLAIQAGDFVGLLDELTDEWFDIAVTYPADNQASLDLKFMQAQPEPLVRHFLTRLWQENDWPLQAMTFEHWEALADLFMDETPPAIDLPGGLRARLSQRATRVVIRAPLAEGDTSDEEEAPLPLH
jgi:tRNA(Ile)-lysidine synthase